MSWFSGFIFKACKGVDEMIKAVIKQARNHGYILDAIKEYWNYEISHEEAEADAYDFYDEIMSAYDEIKDFIDAYMVALELEPSHG